MPQTLIDLSSLLDDSTTRGLLALAVGFHTAAKVDGICQSYRSDRQRMIRGVLEEGKVIACIGLAALSKQELVILHIAVSPAHRNRGIGRWMIQQIGQQTSARRVGAETDSDAVGFYRNCGFAITSLGRNQWGVKRFRCEMELPVMEGAVEH